MKGAPILRLMESKGRGYAIAGAAIILATCIEAAWIAAIALGGVESADPYLTSYFTMMGGVGVVYQGQNIAEAARGKRSPQGEGP